MEIFICKDVLQGIKREEDENKVSELIVGQDKAEIDLCLYIHYLLCSVSDAVGEGRSDDLSFYSLCEKNMCYKNYIGKIKNVLENNNKNQLDKKPDQSYFTFKLLKKDISEDDLQLKQENDSITLNLNLLTKGLMSKGRFDLFLKGYVGYFFLYHVQKTQNQFLLGLSKKLIQIVLENNEPFTDEQYQNLVNIFANPSLENDYKNLVDKVLPKHVEGSQRRNDGASLKKVETLLIQFLGHENEYLRKKATILLNTIYDEELLQINTPFDPDTKIVSDDFTVEVEVKNDLYQDNSILLYSITPFPHTVIKNTTLSFFKPSEIKDTDQGKILIFKIGNFSKCGYYDWALLKFADNGDYTLLKKENKEIKGRFIVQNKNVKKLSMHEVFCDTLSADNKGNFDNLSGLVPEYSRRGINGLYIMGALERDNQIRYNEGTGEVCDIENLTASPMAIVDRSHISSLLGGDEKFKKLLSVCKENKVNIFLDLLARVSSSRYHRKYQDLFLEYVDPKGKLQILYGCEGNSLSYDDSMMLNYRDVRAWDLLVQDTLELKKKYDISGVHLDNSQSWPFIMKLDYEEMERVETDGNQRYSNIQKMNGKVVMPNEECGYWNSGCEKSYPNPFLIKLTKEVWKDIPDFYFIGECVENDKYGVRYSSLIKSGVIPRVYLLPKLYCEIFHKESRSKQSKEKRCDGSLFQSWFEEKNRLLPKGGIILSSSCGHSWPYPLLMYGKGIWPIIDLLFTLDCIPMTFMGEINGETQRPKICKVYEFEKDEPEESSNVSKSRRAKSFMKLDVLNKPAKSVKSTGRVKSLEHLTSLEEFPNSNAQHFDNNSENEISRIKLHYDQRRKMRSQHPSFTDGDIKFIPLTGSHMVVAFARINVKANETSVAFINLSNRIEEIEFSLCDLKNYYDMSSVNTMCYLQDWGSEQKGNFFFLYEVINSTHKTKIRPYSSLMFKIVVIPFSKANYSTLLTLSMSRLEKEIKENKTNDLSSYEISQQLKFLIDNKLSLVEFAKWFNTIQNSLTLYNIYYSTYFSKLGFINTKNYATEYFKYIYKLGKIPNDSFHYKKIPLYVDQIIKANSYGSICFVTPEFGRWSTVGGLGVMVDELTTCLAKLAQDVLVVTPYYHKNRKGEVGYLEKDDAGFIYLRDFSVFTNNRNFTFKIYHGKVNGVKLYFMHNEEVFPSPYFEGGVEKNLLQIALMGKASLELLCNIKEIPSLIVTNDWYTGLTAGFGKGNFFGSVFNQTTFFHICHNLESAYQGKIYDNNPKNYKNIYQLDDNLLIDPGMHQKFINPSRCAIMMSDQWGTVSKSYMQDLLDKSELSNLLRAHKQPFSFPNGIFKEKRLKLLNDLFKGDRVEAKSQIQKKYFKMEKIDDTIPVFSFVGRITQQKGVLLILECTEEIILKTNRKVQILIGGMANMVDPYCVKCVQLIKYLLEKYPKNFWASPEAFFTDGALINFGSDFGLMPSIFEPGGIVQHEFFIAGTPVLAFKTGGLKDSVFEYDDKSKKGNGIVFSNHNREEFISAFTRAVNLFKKKEDFKQCRKNALDSAIDVMDVAIAWAREFYRVKGKTFHDVDSVKKATEEFSKEDIGKFIEDFKTYDEKKYIFDYTDDSGEVIENSFKGKIPVSFSFPPEEGIMNRNVFICGSWDNWEKRTSLSFDPLNFRWNTVLALQKGVYYYKYIVDDVWTVNKNECTQRQDNNENNRVDV